MTSPFQPGPAITPRTQTAAGQGGQQMPPYLQMRKPMTQPTGLNQALANPNSNPTQPVVTPKPSAPGDTVNPPPPQAGGTDLGGVYQFFKSDLENQRNQALANTRADASARGVFYGTPLTGSEADVNTQYLRGLGQLQAGMYGNEQQNQLARLGLASNLGWQNAFNQPPSPGPMDWSGLGAIFGSQPNVAAQRTGPVSPGATATPQPSISPPGTSPINRQPWNIAPPRNPNLGT